MELLLLRHAKAIGHDEGVPDFDRPLTSEGQRQAERVGRLLAHRTLHPDVVITSPAARALQTAQLAAVALGVKASAITQDARIYEGGPQVLAEILAHAVATHKRPMLVGHNPGFEQLAIGLGTLNRGWEFPKGAAARFEVLDRSALRQGAGCRFVELLEP
ncbi:MAG: phosphohistidine phosphatase [Thermoplasmata archaeon]|nr:phosphohistidine phosphatase [Thermoplasmata archaeon]